MTLKTYITSNQGRSALVTGLIIASSALIGAERYPLPFAALAAGWLAVSVIAYRQLQRPKVNA